VIRCVIPIRNPMITTFGIGFFRYSSAMPVPSTQKTLRSFISGCASLKSPVFWVVFIIMVQSASGCRALRYTPGEGSAPRRFGQMP
jgi:hypothetical protein